MAEDELSETEHPENNASIIATTQLTPSGARKCMHGTTFQLKLLNLTFLQAIQNKSRFQLWSEVKEAGKFDDLILGIWKGTTYVLHFLQAKHSNADTPPPLNLVNLLKVSEENLSGDFNFYMYFDNWCKIYERREKFHPNVDKRDCKYYYYLCTNRAIGKDKEQFFSEVHEKDDLLSILSSGICYKFNDSNRKIDNKLHTIATRNGVKEEQIISRIEEFRKHFILAVNIPNEEDLDLEIEKEFQKIASPNSSQMIQNVIEQKMFEWYRSEKLEECNLQMGNDLLVTISTTLLTEMYVFYYNKQYDLRFIEDSLKTCFLEKFLNDKEKDILNLTSKRGTTILILRVLASIEYCKSVERPYKRGDYILLDMECLLPERVKYIENWFRSKFKLIIIKSKNIKDEEEFQIMMKNLKLDGRKIVVVSQTSLIEDSVEIDFNFDHLTPESQEKVLATKVTFQGCQIPLSELGLKNHDFDDELIMKVINKETLQFFGPPNLSTGYNEEIYIERRFIFNRKCYSEEELLNFDNELIILSNIAGMGKSTVLSSMTKKLKRLDPAMLTLRFDLIAYATEIKNLQEKIGEETLDGKAALQFIMDLIKCNKEKEAELEETIFFAKVAEGKVTIFLDGCDEIIPYYTRIVIDLIKCLKTLGGIRIFLTTRPHMVRKLSKKLASVGNKLPVIELEEMSEDEQVRFLQMLLPTNWKNSASEENIRNFLATFNLNIPNTFLKFTGVPLLTRMLGEVCIDETKKEVKLDIQIDDLAHFYELFIEKKFLIHQVEKEGCTAANPAFIRDKEIKFRAFVAIHQLLACKLMKEELLQKEEKRKVIQYIKQFVIGMKNEGLIIRVIQGRPIFKHRSFAEYLFAKFLLEKSINQYEKCQKYEYILSMFDADVTYTRVFLQGLLRNHSVDISYEIPFYTGMNKGQLLKPRCFDGEFFVCMSRLYHENAEGMFEYVLKSVPERPQIIMNTIFLHAVRYAKENIVDKLFEKHVFKFKFEDSEGRNVFHFASQNRRFNHVPKLFSYGQNRGINCDILTQLMDARDRKGLTPLALAIQCSNLTVIETMMQRGVCLMNLNNKCYNIFHLFACFKDDISKIHSIMKFIMNGPYDLVSLLEYLSHGESLTPFELARKLGNSNNYKVLEYFYRDLMHRIMYMN